jgi:hypothetical protein
MPTRPAEDERGTTRAPIDRAVSHGQCGYLAEDRLEETCHHAEGPGDDGDDGVEQVRDHGDLLYPPTADGDPTH